MTDWKSVNTDNTPENAEKNNFWLKPMVCLLVWPQWVLGFRVGGCYTMNMHHECFPFNFLPWVTLLPPPHIPQKTLHKIPSSIWPRWHFMILVKPRLWDTVWLHWGSGILLQRLSLDDSDSIQRLSWELNHLPHLSVLKTMPDFGVYLGRNLFCFLRQELNM